MTTNRPNTVHVSFTASYTQMAGVADGNTGAQQTSRGSADNDAMSVFMTRFLTTMSLQPPIEYLHLLPAEVCFDVAALADGIGQENWVERARHLHRTAARLDTLKQGPYASMVQSWKVSFHIFRPTQSPAEIQNLRQFDTACERVRATFFTALGLYQNLTSLHIRCLIVDANLRATLLSLSRLDDLMLCDCTIVAREGFLRLASLKIISGFGYPDPGGPLQIASPDCLHTLKLDLGNCELLPLFTGFGPGILPQLVHLSINFVCGAGDDETLFMFLGRCPRLASLVINTLPGHFTLKIPTIRPSTIPLLGTLTGPPELIELLTPNRPVAGVTVLATIKDSTEDLLFLCMHISRSTRPIKSLVLPPIIPTLDFLVSITSLFPDLRELTVKIRGESEFNASFATYRTVPRAVTSGAIRWVDQMVEDDTKSEEAPIVTPTMEYIAPEITAKSDIHDILRWIFGGLLSLPPNIQVLRLEVEGVLSGQKLWFTEQRQAVAALSLMYPYLHEVQFGEPMNNWKRPGSGTGGWWMGQIESAAQKQRRLDLETLAAKMNRRIKLALSAARS
ncbi:hypothetical protein B0H19DRAFT_1071098 [Mycena capillaripes]|nr:hypothetical protein B0H19DRAFT_1071098 [Mycena capillaripes]